MPVSIHKPPIDEVVLGFGFPPISGIDPAVAGLYWAQRHADFPTHEIRDPVGETEEGFDVGALRTWLISKDEALVVQIQRDRFYVNWRRRGDAEYPGFTKAILGRALDELRHFESFVIALGLSPVLDIRTVELSKIDLLVQGTHWETPSELASMLPVLAPALQRLGSAFSGIAIRWAEPYPNGGIIVAMHPMQMRLSPEKRAIRIESTIQTMRSAAQLADQLTNASEALNSIYGKIVVTEGG